MKNPDITTNPVEVTVPVKLNIDVIDPKDYPVPVFMAKVADTMTSVSPAFADITTARDYRHAKNVDAEIVADNMGTYRVIPRDLLKDMDPSWSVITIS